MLKEKALYLLTAAVVSSPALYTQQSSESFEIPDALFNVPYSHLPCTEMSCFPLSHEQCDAELESRIVSLQLTVFLSNYTFLLEGKTSENEYCTLLEQRVIIGKKKWRTPEMETTIAYAFTHPTWYPTQNIIEEMKESEPEQFKALSFDERIRKYYVPSGPNNPLGKVKFVLSTSLPLFLHGTPHKYLFDKAKRDFSHGCIRVEDELALLNALSKIAKSDCDESCISQALAAGKSRKIFLKKPIAVKITNE